MNLFRSFPTVLKVFFCWSLCGLFYARNHPSQTSTHEVFSNRTSFSPIFPGFERCFFQQLVIAITSWFIALYARTHSAVINLAAEAFLYGKNPESFISEVESEYVRIDDIKELEAWRKYGPIGKLHNTVTFIRRTEKHFKILSCMIQVLSRITISCRFLRIMQIDGILCIRWLIELWN